MNDDSEMINGFNFIDIFMSVMYLQVICLIRPNQYRITNFIMCIYNFLQLMWFIDQPQKLYGHTLLSYCYIYHYFWIGPGNYTLFHITHRLARPADIFYLIFPSMHFD